jgi:hypothetical protein
VRRCLVDPQLLAVDDESGALAVGRPGDLAGSFVRGQYRYRLGRVGVGPINSRSHQSLAQRTRRTWAMELASGATLDRTR